MKTIAKLAGAFAIAAIAFSSMAQEAAWPSKPIRLLIPSTPGGGTDFIGRTLANKLSASGWTVVPENRPGAAGTLGLSETVRAKADGYEVVVGQTANVSLAPWLMKLTFDPVKDLTPIALAVEAPMVLLVNEASPYKTWADFLKAAKADPSKPMSFATSGTGSVAQVAGEVVQEASGFKMQHVPYKGSAPAIADLMGGHVDVLFASILESASYIKTGKLRGLAVTGAARSPTLPDVPTLAEAGVPNAESGSWIGLLAPAGTPQAILDKLAADVKSVLAEPEMRQKLIEQGAVPRGTGPAELQALIDADRARYGRVIRDKNIGVD